MFSKRVFFFGLAMCLIALTLKLVFNSDTQALYYLGVLVAAMGIFPVHA